MYKLQRKLLSQNFLHSPKLVSRLLGKSSLGKSDLVVEIGSGKGIITEELLNYSRAVIAVELDSHLYSYLQRRFQTNSNLILYNQDFLNFSLPALPYKVFANIPFAIEGKIIRKLLDDKNPPEDCYLIVMKELAIRLEASQKENYFSVCYKPWFDFFTEYFFKRSDFTPHPNVDAVLFRFKRKQNSLLPLKDKLSYQKFVTRGFGHGQAVYHNLRRFYDVNNLNSAFQNLSLSRKVKPTQVHLDQWIRIYREIHFMT